MITIQDLKEVLSKLPGITKNKETIEFTIDNSTIKFNNGELIRGSYYDDSKTVIIYPHLIEDKNDLKEVILHEIGHHLGLSHKEIKH